MKAPPPPRPSPVPPPDSAMASTTGKYSGLQPAITALTATCSTVAVRYMGMNSTTSPFFLVDGSFNRCRGPAPQFHVTLQRYQFIRFVAGALEHRLTRSSVGMTTGRPSVYMEKGAPSNLGILICLVVELLGLGQGAFEEYPRLLRCPTAPFFSSSVRGRVRASSTGSRILSASETPPGELREATTNRSLGTPIYDGIMFDFFSLFVEDNEHGRDTGLLQGRPDKATAY